MIKEFQNLEKDKKVYQDNLIKELKKFKKIMLWGLSESATAAIEFLKNNNVSIAGIYDNDKSKNNTLYQGIKVLVPDNSVYDKDTALVITCSYYETLRKDMLKKDLLVDKRLFMFDGYFLEDKDVSYYEKNKEKIQNCYNNLEDEKSKKLYTSLLKYRYIRNINLLEGLYDSRKDCYLDNVFLNNFKSGLYIDAGSYNADFITTLAERKNVSNCQFYIFEPNKIFSKNIENNLQGKYNFKAFQTALCDEIGNMEFQQIASSTSHLVNKKYNAYNNSLDNNVELVETNTLDNLLKSTLVTGIKVDIEGSELAMLKGSRNVIKRDKPILLISVYHRWSDLWEIQNYIMNLNLGYKFYLRHYSLSVAKTILYCIPKI